jgi:phenylalanyl-tRNA synthetase beta chain
MMNVEYEIRNAESSNYISGRCGKIFVNEKEIGIVGEVAPRVLRNWKVKMPVVGMEMDFDFY